MGLKPNAIPVKIDTSNSTPSLDRLFSFGDPDRKFYIPFAHTRRYLTMMHDASRSIIQTTIQRWASSGSVVTCDPTSYIDIKSNLDGKLLVSTARQYPYGLGINESGFAIANGHRTHVPLNAFAIWYGRESLIPENEDPSTHLTSILLKELNIDSAERDLIFVNEEINVSTQPHRLSKQDIYAVCLPFIEGKKTTSAHILREELPHYTRKVRSMISGLDMPHWLRKAPQENLNDLIDTGAKAILLFGPPRTGKTRSIDTAIKRDAAQRCSIQIHDGWGYDNLVEGFSPNETGEWAWRSGPLKEAIESGKKYIVLEEINRTAISQALGEIFSLIENSYRGQKNAITLRSGELFWIPEDVIFLMTMNTIDKSTEDLDDALWGRLAAVEFPPRAEDLSEILAEKNTSQDLKEQLLNIYTEILKLYPLGHGYFSAIKENPTAGAFITHYRSRIRPVLQNHLSNLRMQDLAQLDTFIDTILNPND